MEKLNKLRDDAYDCACKHGFHDTEQTDEHYLMLVISEIGEAINADRKNHKLYSKKILEKLPKVDYTKESKELYTMVFDVSIKDTFEDEMSDIVIRLLDLAGLRKVNLNDLQEILINEKLNIVLKGSEGKSLTQLLYDTTGTLCIPKMNITNRIFGAMGAIFAIAHKYKIDLWKHIELKMKYNELRPYKNGKEY